MELWIPAGAQIVHVPGDPEAKARASRAQVVALYSVRTGKPLKHRDAYACWRQRHLPRLRYRIGETVTPQLTFSCDTYSSCGSGIHYYRRPRHSISLFITYVSPTAWRRILEHAGPAMSPRTRARKGAQR